MDQGRKEQDDDDGFKEDKPYKKKPKRNLKGIPTGSANAQFNKAFNQVKILPYPPTYIFNFNFILNPFFDLDFLECRRESRLRNA